MSKKIRPGTSLHVRDLFYRTAPRHIHHAIVMTVTSQDLITVSVGGAAPKTATRIASTKTRGTIFATA
jgi:hypothetical protein